MKNKLRVDITFDFVCPWCYIAKVNFDRAIAQLREEMPGITLLIAWHGTRLLPDIPVEGAPYLPFYEKRLGGPEMVEIRRTQVEETARYYGVPLRLDRIATMPNTAKAHKLYRYAVDRNGATAGVTLLEDIFAAYFAYGLNIGDDNVLLDLAHTHALDLTEIKTLMSTSEAPTHDDFADMPVPHFLFDQIHTMAGAHSTAAFLEKFRKIIAQDNHAALAQA